MTDSAEPLILDLPARHVDDSSAPADPVSVERLDEKPWHRYARQRREQQGLGDDDGQHLTETQVELQVLAPPRRQPRLQGLGRMENNLSRKGLFDNHPDRSIESVTVERLDMLGETTLTFTLGILGSFEMDMAAWVMGRWHRNSPTVEFTLRELAREFGLSWKGELGSDIKEGLARIKGTTVRSKVWDAIAGKHITRHFSIFDEVTITERRRSEHGRATSPATVSVRLSSWLVGQLERGQYSDFEWDGYKRRLPNAFDRRLYLLLESHVGDKDSNGTRLVFPINKELGGTLVDDDVERNPSRFRRRLMRAGASICATHAMYQSIEIKAGQRRGEYTLQVRRSPDWLPAKQAQRRRLSAGMGAA